MKKFLFTVLLALPAFLLGQTTTQNYIKNTTYQVPVTDGNQNTVSNNNKLESVSYFDGLGRPIQSVAQRAGGNGQDIVTINTYDGLGRSPKQYLPISQTANGGNYRTTDLIGAINTYYSNEYPEDTLPDGTINAFSETVYEDSWEQRVLEQGAPGNSWKVNPTSDTDHTIKMEYGANTETYQNGNNVVIGDDVIQFSVDFIDNDNNKPSLLIDGIFPANELHKSIVKDENWTPADGNDRTTATFKNKRGQLLLKRHFENNIAHDTYYVYDHYGNLTYVLPPIASDLAFQGFGYDEFEQFVGHQEFTTVNGFPGPNASGGVTISLEGNIVTVDYDVTLDPSQQLRNGSYGNPTGLPGVDLGLIDQLQPGAIPYQVRISQGYLYMAGNILITSIDQTFTHLLPTPTGTVDPDMIAKYGYQYHYDNRNRMVEKKLPQKAWEYIVYDNLDRPILMQDGRLRGQDQWLFTKFDAFGRVAYTGITTFTDPCTTTTTGGGTGIGTKDSVKWGESGNGGEQGEQEENCQRTTIQDEVSQETQLFETRTGAATIDGTTIHYSNNAYPRTNLELHTISYYDDYAFDWNYGSGNTLSNPSAATSYNQATTPSTKGLATGSKVRVLGENDWIISYIVYDTKRRPMYSASHNKFLNTKDITKTKLDFVGRVVEDDNYHYKGITPSIRTRNYFSYDPQGRLITHDHQVGVQAKERIVTNTYDELGLLSRKRVGGKTTDSNGLQLVDLSYNIRGWSRGMNLNLIDTPTAGTTDIFGYKMNYDQKELPDPNNLRGELYNGHISEIVWRTKNTDDGIKGYEYTYDALNRLKEARFATKNIGATDFATSLEHLEQVVAYDKQGNILDLLRRGFENNLGIASVWDDLDYDYDGNQLVAVREKGLFSQHDLRQEGFKDAGPVDQVDYAYDIDGNLTQDLNKGISSIAYNHLNLPTVITTDEGTINYTYDAGGAKLKKVVTPNTGGTSTKEYAGMYIYEQGTLGMFSHPEGYVEKTGGTYTYGYNFVDHLGNVRLTYKDLNGNGSITPSTEILEENNFYAFGLKHKGYNNTVSGNVNSVATTFGYNGMEESDEFGLATLDFGARNYDPALGRWMNIDPLAEQMRRHSPYNYAFNNPVNFIDPDGMAPRSSIHWADTSESEEPDTPKKNRMEEEEEEVAEDAKEGEDDESKADNNDDASSKPNTDGSGNIKKPEEEMIHSNPTKINFLQDLDTPEKKEEFLNLAIEWFGFVKSTNKKVLASDIIDFVDNRKFSFSERALRGLQSLFGDPDDSIMHQFSDSNGTILEISYSSDVANNRGKLSSGYVDTEQSSSLRRISIRASEARGGGRNPAIIKMLFRGSNSSYYDEVLERINSYEYKSVPIIPYNKQ